MLRPMPLLTLLLPLALSQEPDPAPAPEPPPAPEPAPGPSAVPFPPGLPLRAFSLEAGRGATQGGGWGVVGRVHVPHASVDLGFGLRIRQPSPLPAGGASLRGYWRADGTGAYAALGVASLVLDVRETDTGNEAYYRLSPFVGAGFRLLVVEQDRWALPLSLGGSYYRRGTLTSGADRDGFTLDVTLGVQVPVGR